MDWLFLTLRVVHVGSAMIWFGGAIIGSFFLAPTADALGKAGAPFMEHLMRRRRMGIMFPLVAALTIASGAGLYWVDSGGLQAAWITSSSGLTYMVGGIAAVISFVGGIVLVGPSVAEQNAVQVELRESGAPPTEEQQRRLDAADRKMRLATRFDLPILTLAVLTMAVGRYV